MFLAIQEKVLRSPRPRPVWLDDAGLNRAAIALGLIALWFLCRPYGGIVHDSRIYVGRALADLDPYGLGRDIGYVYDAQSRFSIFPQLLRTFVAGVGPSVTAESFTAVGLAAWFLAASFLFSRFLSGRILVSTLLCVCALPSAYGGFGIFHWSEPFATPRLFSEAAALTGLALLVDGRKASSALVLLLAAILHPIMALPAIATAMLFLAFDDVRWLALPLAGGVVTGVAAVAGVPLARQLFERFDSVWLTIATVRGPYLFPLLWPSDSWALIGCQLTTLFIGAGAAEPRLRKIILAAAVVGVLGLAAAAAVATVLVVQLQLWRGLWLISFLAAACLGFAGPDLWKKGEIYRASLAWLAMAWVGRDIPVIVGISCGLAVGLYFIPIPARFHRVLTIASWSLTILFAVALLALLSAGVASLHVPPAARTPLSYSLQSRIPAAVIFTFAMFVGLGRLAPRTRLASFGLAVAATSALAAALLLWDDRSPAVVAREDPKPAAALRSVLKYGTVQWLDSPGAVWLWTMRPEWWSERQGASTIFSRALTMEWSRRLRVLLAAGLARPDDAGAPSGVPQSPTVVTRTGLLILCGAPGGPDWFVAPVGRLDSTLLSRAPFVWQAPQPEYWFDPLDRHWRVNQAFAIFSCRMVREHRELLDAPVASAKAA